VPFTALSEVIQPKKRWTMKIKYLGHAAFVLTSAGGTRIVLDPYEAGAYGGAVGYPPIDETAEIVLLSHDHPDHAYARAVKGNPRVVSSPGTTSVGEIKISGLSTFHDESRGSERGKNIIFTVEMDGLRVTHLGDLGHPLSDKEIAAVGQPDFLLVPVGGFFTIDASIASSTAERLSPRVVIPMHYKTKCCGFPIAPVDGFLKGKGNVKTLGQEVEVSKETLPEAREIWVLQHPTP
jgi:L-ascorbate metabolism protein UlaG (beta-lactamase superfamily)